jgi:hypothetical protein
LTHGGYDRTPKRQAMQTEAPPLATPAAAAEELHQHATTWLVISLASSVLCVSLCLGLGGAVFCYLAMQSARHGLLLDAEVKLKWGKVLTLVGSVMGILSTTLWLIIH